MEIIFQRYGAYDNPTKVTEERFTCKTARRAGDQYIFTMPDGSERRDAVLENCDVTVVQLDGTLKPLK